MTTTTIAMKEKNQRKNLAKVSKKTIDDQTVGSSLFEEKIFNRKRGRSGDVGHGDSGNSTNDGAGSGNSHDIAVDCSSSTKTIPLPRAVQHCWPGLFPTISSAKKSVRKGVFWVRLTVSMDTNRMESTQTDHENHNAEGKGSSLLDSSYRKGSCSTQVCDGDLIRRRLPRASEGHFRKRGTSTEEIIRRAIGGKLRVAYIDRCLAVVVKPHGMPTNKAMDSTSDGQSNDTEDTSSGAKNQTRSDGESDKRNQKISSEAQRIISMHELLLHCMPQSPPPQTVKSVTSTININNEDRLEDDPLRRPAAIHRLDQPTYGLIIVARTRPAARFLSNAFKERAESLVKRYRAIVHGHVEENEDTGSTGTFIRSPLSGKECISEYRVVRRFVIRMKHDDDRNNGSHGSNNSDEIKDPTVSHSQLLLTLVDLFPHSGRTHQLRRHMASIGHPIVGDTRYGDQSIKDAKLSAHCIKSEMLQNSHCSGELCSGDGLQTKSSGSGMAAEGSNLPLMLAAVELKFPHPAFVTATATQHGCSNENRDSKETVSNHEPLLTKKDGTHSTLPPSIDPASAARKIENDYDYGSNDNYIMAGNSEHSLDTSSGTLRVAIDMPGCMKLICENA